MPSSRHQKGVNAGRDAGAAIDTIQQVIQSLDFFIYDYNENLLMRFQWC